MSEMTCEEAEKRYEFRIVDACDALHEWATQGDPYGLWLANVMRFADFLKLRLDTWELGDDSTYDELIRRLAETVLIEYEKKFYEIADGWNREDLTP